MSKSIELTLGFNYYCPVLEQSGKLPLTVWRDGRRLQHEVPVPKESRNLIAVSYRSYPRYFIYGPQAFEGPPQANSRFR